MVVLGQLLETPVRADATFEFRNVPPGRYPLSVEAVGLRGSTVDVGTRDIEGLVLGAEVPGVRVSGRIISSANNLSNLWVTITSSRRALGAPVNADGSFELLPVPLSGVQPATIVVSGNGQWASATLMVGDRDIAGFEIPAPFGASITGRVVIDDGSWLPVPKNIITSSRDYTGIILEVATEQVQGGFRGFQLRLPLDGAFNLMLAEGHYGITLRDVPEGYVVKSITFGPRDLTAVPLEIAPDKTSVGERGSPAPEILISLARAPWGAITGRILHTDGTPAIGVSIGAVPAPQILRATNAGGGITLSGIVQSDGNGRYRIDNVAPGEYYVVAGAPQMGLSDVYMTTPSYFPGASTRAGARLARVDSGATLEADLRLQEPAPPPTPSFTVSGRIAGPLGLPAEAKVVSVKLIIPAQTIRRAPSILERGPAAPCFADAAASFTSGVGPDGVFAIRNVAPGTYTACVTVVLAHSIGTIGAIQTVTVIDRNVTGVEFDGRAGVQYLPIKIN
jgi:hypothetical protein